MIASVLKAVIDFVPKAVYFGLLIAALTLCTIQSCRVDDLKNENATFAAAVKQCEKTNSKNRTVVDFLKLQNSQCIDERKADETRLANAAAAWEAEKKLLQEKAENVEVQNVEVYRTPSCAELAQMDINNVCPDFVNRMRQRAESYNRVRNDNGTGSGTNPP